MSEWYPNRTPINLHARQCGKIVNRPWLQHMGRMVQDALAAGPEPATQQRLQSAALLCRRVCNEVSPGWAEEDSPIYLTDSEVEMLAAALVVLHQ
ncbi:hypothetical protein [Chromobacterium amazonense]|uniref:hypothetical protein n=1 Tax=Chromobacterium amazonense TaxID=1382803 RepID=UPI003F7AC64C